MIDYSKNFLRVPRPVVRELLAARDDVALKLYLALLDRVAYVAGPRSIRGHGVVHLEVGECVVGRHELADLIGAGESPVRSALERLSTRRIIAKQATKLGTRISVLGYAPIDEVGAGESPSTLLQIDQAVGGATDQAVGGSTDHYQEEKHKIREGKQKKQRPEPPAHAIELAQLLHELITKQLPESKIAKHSQADKAKACRTWALDIELLHRRDGIALEHIERAIRWSQADPFWRTNVLSGRKLREKYDTLEAQRTRSRVPPAPLALVGRADPASADRFEEEARRGDPLLRAQGDQARCH